MTTGSARQTTTSSARSRISPKVAVLEPIAWIGERGRAAARGIEDGADRLGEPHRLALRLAARLAQAVDERRARLPQDRGRGVHGLVEADLAARRRVATGGRPPTLSEPRVAERARPRRAPAAVASMSSQAQPHPAQVASATRRHLHARSSSARSRAACSSSPARASCGVAAVATTVQIGWPAAMRSPGCGTSRTPRSSQRTLSPTTTSSVAKRTALPAARERPASTARQLAGAAAQVRVEDADAVRRLDRLERRGRTRVDLDRPRALAVPHEVDAEQPPQRERARQAGADRARLAQQRVALAGRQARRDDVPAPAVAADAERALPDELLGDPEHGRIHAVAHRRRRAREPVDALLHDRPGRQRAAAPLAHARAAAAAQRLAQPAARALGGRRGERRAGTGARRRAAPRRAARDRARRAASAGSLPSSACRSASRATSAGWFSKLAP